MSGLTTQFHIPPSVKIPGVLTKEQAYAMALELGIPIEASVDGEPWQFRLVEDGEVCGMLLDNSERTNGVRCWDCGRPRQAGGYHRGLHWLCSSACLGEHNDFYS